MAFLDNALNFSTAQAITTTAASTSVYDVTSAGSGNSPAMTGTSGLNTAMGFDIGTGDGTRPEVQVNVTTAGTGAGTITIQLQAAPDNGSYSPGSYSTIYQSTAFVGTSLAVNQVITFPVPEIIPGEALPRFYRLNYVVSGSATASFTANLLINPGSVRVAQLYGKNYVA